MTSNGEDDLTLLKFFKSDEARMRVIHKMCGSKQPFPEFYADHLVEVERRRHDAYSQWRARPLHERFAVIAISAFWEFVWMPGKAREGSNPRQYKGGTLRQRLSRVLKPWQKRP